MQDTLEDGVCLSLLAKRLDVFYDEEVIMELHFLCIAIMILEETNFYPSSCLLWSND
jgi:hypothetical protein